MQVKINFKQENLNDKEIEAVKFLQNQIQQQIDIIPNLTDLKRNLEIKNIKFDKNGNIEFDTNYNKNIKGKYKPFEPINSKLLEENTIGSAIGKSLVEIAEIALYNGIYDSENEYQNHICYVDNWDKNKMVYSYYDTPIISVKPKTIYDRIQYKDNGFIGYTCLATTNSDTFNIINEEYLTDNRFHFTGKLDFTENEAYKNFINELETNKYDCSKEIQQELRANLENDDLINYRHLLKEIIKNKQNNYAIIFYDAGKYTDYFIMPEVFGNKETLFFESVISPEETLAFEKQLQNIKNKIIESHIDLLKVDFGLDLKENLNYSKSTQPNF